MAPRNYSEVTLPPKNLHLSNTFSASKVEGAILNTFSGSAVPSIRPRNLAGNNQERFRRLLLWRGRVVSFVAQAHRVRVAAVACPAGYRLIAHGEDASAGKIRIDLPHQHDHLARDILPRVDVYFLRPSPAVTVVAVHVERVAELAHQRVRTVYVRVRRQQL